MKSLAYRSRSIEPLVRRHAQDAAFYWAQHDGSMYSPRLTVQTMARFGELLNAHLDGLALAGAQGFEYARSALIRWRKPAETFVCIWLAQHLADIDAAERSVFDVVQRDPDGLLRGMIGAVGWLPRDHALTAIARWSWREEAYLQVAALRGAALIGSPAIEVSARPLDAFLTSPNPHLRAAACRAVAADRHEERTPTLRALLQDAELAVRAEAAIALARGDAAESSSLAAASALWRCVLAQVQHADEATGWFRSQALRRLNRWIRHLASIAPVGGFDADVFFAQAPTRVALTFVAYHAAPQYLPYVVKQISDPQHARYAGWVWHAITGVDLRAAGLAINEPRPAAERISGPVTFDRLDADEGLPLPDIAAVQRWSGQLPDERCLLGQALTFERALHVLEHCVQSLRGIAAHTLLYGMPQHAVTIRAPMSIQQAVLTRLRAEVKA